MKHFIFVIAYSLVLAFPSCLPAQEKFVPAPVEVSQKTDTIDGVLYILHTVSKGQTLYSIEKAYQCKENDIIREYPKQALTVGEVLRIRQFAVKHANLVSQESSPEVFLRSMPKTEHFKIVLMVPFFLGDVDSISCRANSVHTERSYRYLSFYQGFKMAMDSAKDVSYSLYVYDVSDDTMALHRLLESNDIKTAHLIIAASFVKSTQMIDEFSKKHGIPFIHPLTERELKTNNPYYIQASPSMKTQIEEWAEFLCENKDTNTQYIVVSDSNKSANSHLYAKQFYEHCVKKTVPSLSMLYVAEKGFPKLENQLLRKKKNLVIGFYDKPLNYSKLLFALQSVRSNIMLAGMSQWVDFNKNESKYLNKLKFAYFSPYFADFNAVETEIFEQEFHKHYFSLPDKLAYKGYDLANFVLTSLAAYNTGFITNLEKIDYQGLAYDFKFVRRDKAYENKAIRKIKLDHWEYKPFSH